MIDIKDKADCVGCNACFQRCPVSCINMVTDDQGFKYPVVDTDRCINCNLCERVCPVLIQKDEVEPLEVLAAANPDTDIRSKSTSGGVFYALASKVITNGGIVFGARFNENFDVIHDYADSMDGIQAFMGSKYVQSEIGRCFLRAEEFLKSGRSVLFSGTPCQIAGLNLFLRKDYPNLTTVEVICHGVPSPLVWSKYLECLKTRYSSDISSASFRDKHYGWESFSMAVGFDNNAIIYRKKLNSDPYLLGFLKNLYLRPSCYKCPAKCGKSHADITLGDYWHIRHIQPKSYRFNGVSLVLANSEKGRVLLRSTNIEFAESSYKKAAESNSAIFHCVKQPEGYADFWRNFHKNGADGLIDVVKRYAVPLHLKIKMGISNRIKQMLAKFGIEKF